MKINRKRNNIIFESIEYSFFWNSLFSYWFELIINIEYNHIRNDGSQKIKTISSLSSIFCFSEMDQFFINVFIWISWASSSFLFSWWTGIVYGFTEWCIFSIRFWLSFVLFFIYFFFVNTIIYMVVIFWFFYWLCKMFQYEQCCCRIENQIEMHPLYFHDCFRYYILQLFFKWCYRDYMHCRYLFVAYYKII